jgi:hypothetical protein
VSRVWTVDALSPDVISNTANMTLQKRREWARIFISARHHGVGRLRLLFFSLGCTRELGSWVPFLVAWRVVPRVGPTRGRTVRPTWHIPPTWAPRALGLLAVGIFFWALLTPHPKVIHVEPSPQWPTDGEDSTDWLARDGGTIAVPMPLKRLDRQQTPPCKPPPGAQEEINGGCWSRLVQEPPCDQFYEHEGHCYVPVRETPKPPTSVDP